MDYNTCKKIYNTSNYIEKNEFEYIQHQLNREMFPEV